MNGSGAGVAGSLMFGCDGFERDGGEVVMWCCRELESGAEVRWTAEDADAAGVKS